MPTKDTLSTDLAAVRAAIPAANAEAHAALGRIEEMLTKLATAMMVNILADALKAALQDVPMSPEDIPTVGPMQ